MLFVFFISFCVLSFHVQTGVVMTNITAQHLVCHIFSPNNFTFKLTIAFYISVLSMSFKSRGKFEKFIPFLCILLFFSKKKHIGFRRDTCIFLELKLRAAFKNIILHKFFVVYIRTVSDDRHLILHHHISPFSFPDSNINTKCIPLSMKNCKNSTGTYIR